MASNLDPDVWERVFRLSKYTKGNIDKRFEALKEAVIREVDLLIPIMESRAEQDRIDKAEGLRQLDEDLWVRLNRTKDAIPVFFVKYEKEIKEMLANMPYSQ